MKLISCSYTFGNIGENIQDQVKKERVRASHVAEKVTIVKIRIVRQKGKLVQSAIGKVTSHNVVKQKIRKLIQRIKKQYVRLVRSDENHDNKDDIPKAEVYLFTVGEEEVNTQDSEVIVNMRGINVHVLIDSGASVNVIDRKLWEKLKVKNIQCDTYLTVL